MKYEIRNRPNYASLHVSLKPGDAVVTEAGAMMGMSSGILLDTSLSGGPWGALQRRLSGESMFLNTYTATRPGQRNDIAPAMPGDLVHVNLDGNALVVSRGAYCASTPGIDVDAKWGGWKSVIGGEGLVMLRCQGRGDLFLSSYGAIQEIPVSGTVVVDTSHVVAFDESLSWFPKPVGNVNSLLRSGEGIVMQFTGNGRVWIQTRCAPGLAEFLHPYRRRKAWWKRFFGRLNPLNWIRFGPRTVG
ncbi:MAG: TIGR00266 family protein [Myxococcota bacterium]